MNLTQPSERFDTLGEAEDTLKHQGFKLVPDTCNWIDEAGLIDAGVYPVEGRYGVSKYRIEYRTLKGKRGVMAGPSHTPVDPTRRRFLSVAAGASVASVGTLAVAAMPASAPDSPACAVDPIHAVIDRHKQAIAAHDNATDVRAHFNDLEMDDHQKAQLAELEAAVDEAYGHLDDAGTDLVNTKPTTLAGIAALCRYIEPLLSEKDTINLPEVIHWDDDTQSSAGGALANAIAAAVEALIKVAAGKAAQS